MHERCVEGTRGKKKTTCGQNFAVVPPDGKHLSLPPAPGHGRPVDDTRDGKKWKRNEKRPKRDLFNEI